MNSPLVSIIVPIYKVEKYLNRAINSIINQTYQNLEIILVDDGSPDRCPQMCDEYATKDSRIKVIHKLNGGLSDARNAALDIVTGLYITFVDSDDYIANNMIEVFVNTITNNNVQMVTCGINIINSYGKIYDYRSTNYSKIYSGETITKNIIQDKYPFNFACGKFYCTHLFKDIRFPKGRIYEDTGTIYKIAAKCNFVYCLQNNLYFYEINREGNLTSELKTYKAVRSYQDAITNDIERIKFCLNNENYKDLLNDINKHMQLMFKLGMQASIPLGKNKYIKFYKQNKDNILIHQGSPLKHSVQFLLTFPTIYYHLYSFYKKLKH